MKPVIWLIPAILIFSMTSRAQETPAWDVSAGYSYLYGDFSNTKFHLNGGTASMTENLNSWFGGRFEVDAYQGTVSGTNVTAQTVTYGPVLTYRHFKSVTPFVHAQVGAIHASQGYLGISQSAFKFAIAPGVGADFKISKRAAIRVQADYMLSTFLGLRQNNLQGSVGVVVRFGRK